jgi:hypothetical protein
MKKLLTILLTLFLFSSAYAESRVVNELEYKDFVAYAVGENKAYTGIYEWHYSNGQIGRQATYKDGLKHGKETTWWDFGDKKAVISFYKGEAKEDIFKSNITTNLEDTLDEKYTGEYIELDNRGMKKRRTLYKNGLRHGKSIVYNYDGSEQDFSDNILPFLYGMAWLVVIYVLISSSKKTLLLVVGSYLIYTYLSVGVNGLALGLIYFSPAIVGFMIIIWIARSALSALRKNGEKK